MRRSRLRGAVVTGTERMAYAGWLPLRREPREARDYDYPALDRDDVDTGEDCDALEAFYAAREVLP